MIARSSSCTSSDQMRPASYHASSWCSRTMLLRASDSHASAAPRMSPARCRTSASNPHATTSPGSSVEARSSSERAWSSIPRRDAVSPARESRAAASEGRGDRSSSRSVAVRYSPSSPCALACAWSMRSDQREGSPSAAASSTMSRVASQLPSVPRIRRRAASSACAVHSPGPVPFSAPAMALAIGSSSSSRPSPTRCCSTCRRLG